MAEQRVFVSWNGYEEIHGVYLTLEEAMRPEPSRVDEMIVGQVGRIASYDEKGKKWMEKVDGRERYLTKEEQNVQP